MPSPAKVLLQLNRAPGDSVALTAFVRDLKLFDPSRQIAVDAAGGNHIYAYNPHISLFRAEEPDWTILEMDYRPGIRGCKMGMRTLTYTSEFHRCWYRNYKETIPLTDPKPELFLTDWEKMNRPFPFRYWVTVAGYKTDMDVKQWSRLRFQEVINRTSRANLQWVQVGHLSNPGDPLQHIHFALNNVIDLLGKTSIRELIHLIYHADGVLCGTTMAMLIAAALSRPCVVLAGGRESNNWISFTKDNAAWGSLTDKITVPHKVFHSIGKLSCARVNGCYSCSAFAPHRDSPFPCGYLCASPTFEPDGQVLPECMRLINPDDVVQAIDSYYLEGYLPPLN